MSKTIPAELEAIPDEAWVPLRLAHLLVGRGRSTIYQWYRDDRLVTRDVNRGTEVQAGEIRQLADRMIEQRKRRPKSGVSGVAELDSMD